MASLHDFHPDLRPDMASILAAEENAFNLRAARPEDSSLLLTDDTIYPPPPQSLANLGTHNPMLEPSLHMHAMSHHHLPPGMASSTTVTTITREYLASGSPGEARPKKRGKEPEFRFTQLAPAGASQHPESIKRRKTISKKSGLDAAKFTIRETARSRRRHRKAALARRPDWQSLSQEERDQLLKNVDMTIKAEIATADREAEDKWNTYRIQQGIPSDMPAALTADSLDQSLDHSLDQTFDQSLDQSLDQSIDRSLDEFPSHLRDDKTVETAIDPAIEAEDVPMVPPDLEEALPTETEAPKQPVPTPKKAEIGPTPTRSRGRPPSTSNTPTLTTPVSPDITVLPQQRGQKAVIRFDPLKPSGESQHPAAFKRRRILSRKSGLEAAKFTIRETARSRRRNRKAAIQKTAEWKTLSQEEKDKRMKEIDSRIQQEIASADRLAEQSWAEKLEREGIPIQQENEEEGEEEEDEEEDEEQEGEGDDNEEEDEEEKEQEKEDEEMDNQEVPATEGKAEVDDSADEHLDHHEAAGSISTPKKESKRQASKNDGPIHPAFADIPTVTKYTPRKKRQSIKKGRTSSIDKKLDSAGLKSRSTSNDDEPEMESPKEIKTKKKETPKTKTKRNSRAGKAAPSSPTASDQIEQTEDEDDVKEKKPATGGFSAINRVGSNKNAKSPAGSTASRRGMKRKAEEESLAAIPPKKNTRARKGSTKNESVQAEAEKENDATSRRRSLRASRRTIHFDEKQGSKKRFSDGDINMADADAIEPISPNRRVTRQQTHAKMEGSDTLQSAAWNSWSKGITKLWKKIF